MLSAKAATSNPSTSILMGPDSQQEEETARLERHCHDVLAAQWPRYLRSDLESSWCYVLGAPDSTMKLLGGLCKS